MLQIMSTSFHCPYFWLPTILVQVKLGFICPRNLTYFLEKVESGFPVLMSLSPCHKPAIITFTKVFLDCRFCQWHVYVLVTVKRFFSNKDWLIRCSCSCGLISAFLLKNVPECLFGSSDRFIAVFQCNDGLLHLNHLFGHVDDSREKTPNASPTIGISFRFWSA